MVRGKGEGRVIGLSWHFERDEYVFSIDLGGSRLKKRVFASDLSPASSQLESS